ncbi:MAG: dTMP kinase [Candidatus Limnocylindrales bacterium]
MVLELLESLSGGSEWARDQQPAVNRYAMAMRNGSTSTSHRAIRGGLLVALEGIDGGGKSTLAARLCEALRSEGWLVTITGEPGGSSIGGSLRQILKHSEVRIDDWTEAFLFEADRAQTFAEVIRPALRIGGVVLSDRGPFGTIAYQGHGRGLDLGLIERMNAAAWPRPADLVFVIDVSPEMGLGRKGSGSKLDRFESQDREFLERARAGYLSAAQLRGPDAVVIDGGRSADEVFIEVLECIHRRLDAGHTDVEDLA